MVQSPVWTQRAAALDLLQVPSELHPAQQRLPWAGAKPLHLTVTGAAAWPDGNHSVLRGWIRQGFVPRSSTELGADRGMPAWRRIVPQSRCHRHAWGSPRAVPRPPAVFCATGNHWTRSLGRSGVGMWNLRKSDKGGSGFI